MSVAARRRYDASMAEDERLRVSHLKKNSGFAVLCETIYMATSAQRSGINQILSCNNKRKVNDTFLGRGTQQLQLLACCH